MYQQGDTLQPYNGVPPIKIYIFPYSDVCAFGETFIGNRSALDFSVYRSHIVAHCLDIQPVKFINVLIHNCETYS